MRIGINSTKTRNNSKIKQYFMYSSKTIKLKIINVISYKMKYLNELDFSPEEAYSSKTIKFKIIKAISYKMKYLNEFDFSPEEAFETCK